MIYAFTDSVGGYYQVEVAEGEAIPDWARGLTPTEVQQPSLPQPGVPAQVTMRQARLALLNIGMLPAIEEAINALPSPQREAARIEWEYSQEVRRTQPFVLQRAPALGLTDEQLDALFVVASEL